MWREVGEVHVQILYIHFRESHTGFRRGRHMSSVGSRKLIFLVVGLSAFETGPDYGLVHWLTASLARDEGRGTQRDTDDFNQTRKAKPTCK